MGLERRRQRDSSLRTLPCLTICQPWAWAVMHAGKDVENRSWESLYRGPLLIHAGASHDWMCDRKFIEELGITVPDENELAFGAILGLVDQVDCHHYRFHAPESLASNLWAEGPFCHMYANPRPFARPVPFRGRQKFFGVPLAMVPEAEVLMRQAGGTAPGGTKR